MTKMKETGLSGACHLTLILMISMACFRTTITQVAKHKRATQTGTSKGQSHLKTNATSTIWNAVKIKEGETYETYECSPTVTEAVLTLNSFEEGGDGGWPSQHDEKFHSGKTLVVALSTGWYDKGKRCLEYITIYGNERSVKAKVVDQCDSTMGFDPEHAYQPPCKNYVVDASQAVWEALGVPEKDWDG